MKFEEYEWHDSVIKSITINRSESRIKDEILFEIEWVNGKSSLLKFEDVYWASLNLNFGFIGEENILYAEILNEMDDDLVNFYSKWKGLMDNVKLQVFYIETNTSASKIKILAKECTFIDY